MGKKKTNLFEQHVDKLVLGVAGLVSLAVLWLFVLRGPYSQTIGGRRYGPGQIDQQIKPTADTLKQKLDEPAQDRPYVADKSKKFADLYRSPLASVPDWWLPRPGFGEKVREERRLYALPAIPPTTKAVAGLIRTVVYQPQEEGGAVRAEIAYSAPTEQLTDIDLVTVEATIDVQTLYRNFEQCFAGPAMRLEWKDPRYAKPVFAAVGLERRQLQEDGSWTDWQRLGPTRVNPVRKLLEVPEDASKMTFDVRVLMDRFDTFEIASQLLQPDTYDFASPRQTWLIPSLHKEFVRLQEDQQEKQLREKREQMLQERERDQAGRARTNDPTRTRQPRGGAAAEDAYGYGGRSMTDARRQPRGRNEPDARRGADRGRPGMESEYMDEYYGGMPDPSGRRPLPPGAVKEKAPNDVLVELTELMIGPKEDLGKRDKPLVFWAYDDTLTQPGTYQYRIRTGVFNPIAGKDWVAQQQADLKNQVILWSDYSEVTDPVVVTDMVHFFPTELAADAPDALKVKVARYHYGRWRSQEFRIGSGEPIGKSVEIKPAVVPGAGRGMEAQDAYRMGYGGGMMPLGPETIDFSTGAVLMDVASSVQWSGLGALQRRSITEALYTKDGSRIEHVAVGQTDWPPDVRTLYELVKQDEDEGPFQYQSPGQGKLKREAAFPAPGMMPGAMPGDPMFNRMRDRGRYSVP